MSSVLLPEPETPHSPTSAPSGSRNSWPRRLLARAPRHGEPAGRLAPGSTALPQQNAFVLAVQPAPGGRVDPGHLLGRSAGDDLAAQRARARPHVDQVVGGAHDGQLVLDHDHGVAFVAQGQQHIEQRVDLGRVQAARGFVEQHGQRGQAAAQQAGQLDALGLAGRERGGHAVEVQIAQADLVEKAQSVDEGAVAGGLTLPVRPSAHGRSLSTEWRGTRSLRSKRSRVRREVAVCDQFLQDTGQLGQRHLVQLKIVAPVQRHGQVVGTEPPASAVGTGLVAGVGAAHVPVADPAVEAGEVHLLVAHAAGAAAEGDRQRFGIAEEEGLLRGLCHLLPGRFEGVEAVAGGQALHNVVAAVEGLAQIAFGEEARRVHGPGAERTFGVDDQLVRLGRLQTADAATGQAGRGVVAGQKVPTLGHRRCRLHPGQRQTSSPASRPSPTNPRSISTPQSPHVRRPTAANKFAKWYAISVAVPTVARR